MDSWRGAPPSAQNERNETVGEAHKRRFRRRATPAQRGIGRAAGPRRRVGPRGGCALWGVRTGANRRHARHLGRLLCFSSRKGMRSGRAISTLPRGAVAGVAASPAPLVSARPPAASRLRRCSSPPLSCSFASRLRGGLEICPGEIWTYRKSFAAPVLTFGTDVNLPLTFTYVPFRDAAHNGASGRFRKNPKISFVLL